MRILAVLILMVPAAPVEAVLFDFEEEADPGRGAAHAMPEVKESAPPLRVERVAEHATSGRHALKITTEGGFWPAGDAQAGVGEAVRLRKRRPYASPFRRGFNGGPSGRRFDSRARSAA